MAIEFSTTASGERTCTANNIKLHSAYNPAKEAERFVQQITCIFNPKHIVVTEPALSHCIPFLKARFPESELICVRYESAFSDTDECWSKVFQAKKGGGLNGTLDEEMFNYLGEEGICSAIFLQWIPSSRAFPEEDAHVWKKIRDAVLKSRSVLATRNYFASRWMRNSLRFSLFIEKNGVAARTSMPAVITASGPSLADNFSMLRRYRDRFLLIAVSSSLRALTENGIIPDICISTDGGFWAKKHIEFALKTHAVPLALPAEGSCFAEIMEKSTVIPLFYGDGPSDDITGALQIHGMKALRNGSVSGTAADFALRLTSGNVYFVGLDLAATKGFVHTQPNELETGDSVHDTRISTAETRAVNSLIGSAPLEVYRSWFKATDFKGRLRRLNVTRNSFSIGTMPETDWNDFLVLEKNSPAEKPEIIPGSHRKSREEKIKVLTETVEKNKENPLWIKDALVAESIIHERSKGFGKEAETEAAIKDGMEDFCVKILKSIGIS